MWEQEKQQEIDAANARISKKTDLLAAAREAFIEERTLLQRRWAETERQGMEALERAHEEAERILRVARTQASEMTPNPLDVIEDLQVGAQSVGNFI